MGKRNTGFDKFLVIDCETSGLFMNSTDPSQDHSTGDYYQAVSWGALVVNANTLEVVDECYVEVAWDGQSLWSDRAEQVHGLSKEHLRQHGLDETDAVAEIGGMILDWWGPTGNVICAGHNVGTFDVPFMRAMFLRHQIPIRFAHRHIDTFSGGYLMFGTTDSDELFNMTSDSDRPTTHNALDDAKMALRAIVVMKQLGAAMLS